MIDYLIGLFFCLFVTAIISSFFIKFKKTAYVISNLTLTNMLIALAKGKMIISLMQAGIIFTFIYWIIYFFC